MLSTDLSSSSTLSTLLKDLSDAPDLVEHLGLTQLIQFLDVCHRLWPQVLVHNPHPRGTRPDLATLELPGHIEGFLAAVFKLSSENITRLWRICLPVLPFHSLRPPLEDHFRSHGATYRLGAYPLLPPFVATCPRDECNKRKLGEVIVVESRLYTLHQGVVPVFPCSFYCHGCHTRYHPNYSVRNASSADAQREYYPGVPRFIQVAGHSYIEDQLCIYFETQMCFAQSSAQTISRIYNQALGSVTVTEIPNRSTLQDDLPESIVLDAFFLHALLRDSNQRGVCLSLPHSGDQRQRFNTALRIRNQKVAGTGQEKWAHACTQCHKVRVVDEEYVCLDAGVVDGITLGHTCCTVQDCRIPLDSPQDRYCLEHRHKQGECAVSECLLPADSGRWTCSRPDHRQLEDSRSSQIASGQEQRRAQRSGISLVNSDTHRLEGVETPQSITTSTGTTSGKKLKLVTKRRWTHNEQLFVRCCGIILSRATFYGSEGLTGVKDFLKVTFPPEFPGSLPSFIFYDNNCGLYQHLRKQNDHYFDATGLPIDVFHAFNKTHKHNDNCRRTANPLLFPELKNEKGEWIFNSSAAEQTNAWLGGFQSILKEMPVLKYNFYLDEMISIRNRWLEGVLEKRGFNPHLKPESVLRDHVVCTC